MSENIPTASITTRLDGFQGVQVPHRSSVSLYPTLYPIPGLSCPPLASLPNSFLLAPPSFSLGDYGAGGPSFVLNNHGQGTIFPPANVIPSLFPIDNACLQESFYHFAGMLPGNPANDPLPSEDSDYHEQPVPLACQWTFLMQPLATAPWQQAQCQVPQKGIAEMEPPCEPGSVYRGDCQMNGALHGAPSALEVCPQCDQGETYSGFQLPADNVMSKNGRKPQKSTNRVGLTVWHIFCILILQPQRGAEEYYCEPVINGSPFTKRRSTIRSTRPTTYVCRICEILGKACRP